MDERGNIDEGPGRRPIPDPTLLTTQQLQREIASLKELVYTRLDGIEKAQQQFQDDITEVPTAVDKEADRLEKLINNEIAHLKEYITSQQHGLADLIRAHRDYANEAARKTEISVAESIRHIETRKEDLKERVVKLESTLTTQAVTRSGIQTTQGHFVAVGAAVIAVLFMIGGAIVTVMNVSQGSQERVIVVDPSSLKLSP